MLVTKDTRDEAFLYSAKRKERKMHQELDRLRRDLKQKIFVGEPGGEMFVTASPERVLEAKREQIRAPETEPPARKPEPRRKGPTTLDEF